jgi:hypothetical protein
VLKKDILNFIWSGDEIDESDLTYIFGKYPPLEVLHYCICDFRDIYVKKDAQLLDDFIAKYSICSIDSIISFANGLRLDYDAVKNSVLSDRPEQRFRRRVREQNKSD